MDSSLVEHHRAWFDLLLTERTQAELLVGIERAVALVVVHCAAIGVFIWTEGALRWHLVHRLLAFSAHWLGRRIFILGLTCFDVFSDLGDVDSELLNSSDFKFSCQHQELIQLLELNVDTAFVDEVEDFEQIAVVDVQLDFRLLIEFFLVKKK